MFLLRRFFAMVTMMGVGCTENVHLTHNILIIWGEVLYLYLCAVVLKRDFVGFVELFTPLHIMCVSAIINSWCC